MTYQNFSVTQLQAQRRAALEGREPSAVDVVPKHVLRERRVFVQQRVALHLRLLLASACSPEVASVLVHAQLAQPCMYAVELLLHLLACISHATALFNMLVCVVH